MTDETQNQHVMGPGLLSDIALDEAAIDRSFTIQSRAATVNFDWQNADDVMEKLREEVEELAIEMRNHDKKAMRDELGDILFTCVNLSRHLKINLEEALQVANDKFLRRFAKVEQYCIKHKIDLKQTPFDELLVIWEQIKRHA
ncbi:MAG: hypothetical protein K0U29_02590 [Gammaproteobacteria bacterium]|nr:hypothetical protein [Gammaproteobacteria bacterium]